MSDRLSRESSRGARHGGVDRHGGNVRRDEQSREHSSSSGRHRRERRNSSRDGGREERPHRESFSGNMERSSDRYWPIDDGRDIQGSSRPSHFQPRPRSYERPIQETSGRAHSHHWRSRDNSRDNIHHEYNNRPWGEEQCIQGGQYQRRYSGQSEWQGGYLPAAGAGTEFRVAPPLMSGRGIESYNASGGSRRRGLEPGEENQVLVCEKLKLTKRQKRGENAEQPCSEEDWGRDGADARQTSRCSAAAGRETQEVAIDNPPEPQEKQDGGRRGASSDTGRGGGGRGGGRGGRGAGRGARRGRRSDNEYSNVVVTRPTHPEGGYMKKQAIIDNGSVGVPLQTNYFKVEGRPNWCVYQYRVDFTPDERDTRLRKKLLKQVGDTLGPYMFDGTSLYMPTLLQPDPMQLYVTSEQNKIEIAIRLVSEVAPTDGMYLQILNIMVRKCLVSMELEELGRHFYDRHQAILIEAHHLELWPGYKTSMRNHENEILLGVELTYKVLRRDNCLHAIKNLERDTNDRKRIRDFLVGNVVMTSYNRKTYRVDDIDWDTTPQDSFDFKGKRTSFIEYFERYGRQGFISDGNQPMLVSRPRKRDFHRGCTGPILLVPELCRMTGLTEEMRANHNLMKALASQMLVNPASRVKKLKDFIFRLNGIPSIREELKRWDLKIQTKLVEFEGHRIPPEPVLFGAGKYQDPNINYGWDQAFRSMPMLTTIPLDNWFIIFPSREAHILDKLVNTMQRVSRPTGFRISNPIDVFRVQDGRPNEYANAVDMIMNQFQAKVQMIFAILPRQATDTYSAVKKRACIQFGVPSQCLVAKNAHNEKGLMSICTKLIVQMNAKLGGEPWTLKVPLKNLMVVGFDVYHCGKRRGNSVGAMVASTSSTLAKYFSTTNNHSGNEDLSAKMGVDFTKCLNAYYKANKELPERIIMYRDGVGDGQLNYVCGIELKTIKERIKTLYEQMGKPMPKFTFIIVSRRINTRLFELDDRGRPTNPGPGTVADDIVTLPERYDFFLVSQFSRVGTQSPTCYNVIYDRQGLDADKMQRLTFKMCHMYFNWNGTVTVPAPCQYAHKLAYLTGLSLGGPAHEKLSNLLYYL